MSSIRVRTSGDPKPSAAAMEYAQEPSLPGAQLIYDCALLCTTKQVVGGGVSLAVLGTQASRQENAPVIEVEPDWPVPIVDSVYS